MKHEIILAILAMWAAWHVAVLLWAILLWGEGLIHWHRHRKHCRYCAPKGRQSPFAVR